MPGHPHPYRLLYDPDLRRTEFWYLWGWRQPARVVTWIGDQAVEHSPIDLARFLSTVAEYLRRAGQTVIWVEHPQGADFGSEPLATPTGVEISGTTYTYDKTYQDLVDGA